MKRVLITFPSLMIKNEEGSKHRLICHINEYKRHGYKVDVLAFCKDAFFSCDKRYLTAEANWIIRPMLFPRGRNIFFTHLLMAYLKIVIGMQTWFRKYDVVQMELFGSRSFLSKKGPTYITDIHGDSIYEMKEMRKGKDWLANYNRKQQEEFIDRSDICIVVSNNLKKQLEDNTGSKINKYFVISCGVDVRRFMDATPAAIDEVNSNDKIVIGYCGGLQRWQNSEAMVELVIKLRKLDPRVFFLIFTNSNPDPVVTSKLNELGKENYMIKGLSPVEVPSYLKLMDAGLLLRSDYVTNIVSSPTKICEYLAAGVPLVCTQYAGDYARSVTPGKNGFVAKSPQFTDKEIEELLKWLNYVKGHRTEIAKECVASVQDRTFEAEFNDLAELLGKEDVLKK